MQSSARILIMTLQLNLYCSLKSFHPIHIPVHPRRSFIDQSGANSNCAHSHTKCQMQCPSRVFSIGWSDEWSDKRFAALR